MRAIVVDKDYGSVSAEELERVQNAYKQAGITLELAHFTSEDEIQAKQVQWLYYHKYWLFSLAGGIDCVISAVEQALQEWSKEDIELATKSHKA